MYARFGPEAEFMCIIRKKYSLLKKYIYIYMNRFTLKQIFYYTCKNMYQDGILQTAQFESHNG